MDLELTGKRVFVTGGSVGIGLAVARKFAAECCKVAICARNAERVEQEAKRIADDYSVVTLGITADVTKPDDIATAHEKIVEAFGGLDILINNAGTGSEETVQEASDERWYYYWDLHVMAAIRTVRAFIPEMKQAGGGIIINTASICAKQPLWYEPIYNTTKAALVMMGKCLANEVVDDNIRVNTISPGLVRTPDWEKTGGILAEKEGITVDEFLSRVAHKHAPIKRFASTEEIADLYVYLASPRASYVVGSNFYIDGGWLRVAE